MRESGYYWVRRGFRWYIFQYYSKGDSWQMIGREYTIENDEIEEVGDRIEVPEKYRVKD
jgi:hypothetical protein